MVLADDRSPPKQSPRAGRFAEEPAMDLRSRTARGTIINAVFMVTTNVVTFVQGVIIAGLLPPRTYGLWGLLMAAFMTLITFGSVGIDDKYIQQDDDDQQAAFEMAFTLQMLVGVILVMVILVGMPLFALVYGRPEMVGPGAALAVAIPAMVLQMPLWVHYRRMNFARQRMLQSIDPVVTFVATVGLALVGLGIWALVLGAMIGTWAASIAMIRNSPYPLRLRWDRAAAKEYTRFSWPLLAGTGMTFLLTQVPVTLSSHLLGLTAVAGLTLVTSITSLTRRVDELITQTLYPAVCAVKDRSDLVFEAFWKSNRLALLWATPCGTAVALFAGDFVHYVIGEKWRFAVGIITIYGLIAVITQIGFNWSAFFRALGNTRPMAVAGAVDLVAVMGIAVPLLVTRGLTGFGVGILIATVIAVCVRMGYLRSIFPGLPVVGHVARGIGPTLPAAAGVLGVRLLESGPRSLPQVVSEAALFAALAIGATYASERTLLRESVGYLRGAGLRGAPRSAPA